MCWVSGYWVMRRMAGRTNNLSQQEQKGHRVWPLLFLPHARAKEEAKMVATVATPQQNTSVGLMYQGVEV